MTYREIRDNYQHKFSWDSVLVDGYTLLLSPFVTKICLKLKLIPNVITLLMMISGIVGGICFAIPGIVPKIFGLIFIHLWYVFDCSDGEVARITKRYSKFGTEIDYTAHVIDHPFIMLGICAAICQSDTVESTFVILVAAAVTVLDLVFRCLATFGLIYDCKLPKAKTETVDGGKRVFSFREKLRFFIGTVVHLPNFALICPIVYFISPKAAFVYMCIVLVGLLLYVPIVLLSWLRRIVNS